MNTQYRSYLLRLWRVEEDDDHWRASLECVDSGEQRGFSTLEDLFTFLRKSTSKRDIQGPTTGNSKRQHEA